MAVRYVLTELRQGLQRNFSMHLAVVITLLVSMTLAGVGYLLVQQASDTRESLKGELQITVFLCLKDPKLSHNHCTGLPTAAQKTAIINTLTKADAAYVSRVDFNSAQKNFSEFHKLNPELAQIQGLERTPESYDVTMRDAHKVGLITDSVASLPGVEKVRDQRDLVQRIVSIIDAMMAVAVIFASVLVLGALVLVANTVRLAAFARRREIAIMRLVGASSLYIMLPFLLEVLVTALIGGALAVGTLAAYQHFVVQQVLAPNIRFTWWTTWHDWAWGSVWVMVVSTALAVVPALLMTRRYVKV